MKNLTVALISSFISTLLCAQISKPFNPDEYLKRKDSINQSRIGKPYPGFEHIADDGKLYSNKSLSGKKYYLNFWFEACSPCMKEMDTLIELNKKLKGTDSEFISFTFDKPADVKRLRIERGLNFIVICVSEQEAHRLNFGNGFPKHIVVDEKGNMIYISSTFQSNEQSLKEITDILLN